MVARLRFIDDSEPGITRRLIRGKWGYFAPGGTRITDRGEIDRLNAVALPPAYANAWFSPVANAHLLDTVAIRVGNEAYGRDNNSFGTTTPCNRHAKVDGGVLRLRFRGKGGHPLPDRLPRRTRWLSAVERGLIAWLAKIPDLAV
jgi:DNA topoisomerase I